MENEGAKSGKKREVIANLLVMSAALASGVFVLQKLLLASASRWSQKKLN